ncbi:MAG: 30S ribosomal protein S9 [Candidatus Cloacimonetes bacterium]|nr:30S ribosomal protein S9 [Candidatus Cloacimonadota bacterium]
MAKVEKYYGTGRRKSSSARVWVKPATEAKYTVNEKTVDEYLCGPLWIREAGFPLAVTETLDRIEVWATVKGGGPRGQAGALALGLSRALLKYNPNLRPALKEAGLLTRDSRIVERKKPGLKKARKKPQFSKR